MKELESKKEKQEKKEVKKIDKEGNYYTMVENYSKHLKENPTDNVNKFETSKLNIIPKVSPNTVQITTQTTTQKNIEETTNTNPMMYSFGQGSIEGSNVQSSIKVSGSGLTFGQDGIITNQYISGSNVNIDNKTQEIYSKTVTQSSGLGMSGKYYFNKVHTSYSTIVREGEKEPMDTDKKKKKEKEAEIEFEEFEVGPRDSKRK